MKLTILGAGLSLAYFLQDRSDIEHIDIIDLSGDNFAFMNPEKDIIFHRISKMDFLGDAYKSDSATYMVEVTYRKNDYTDQLSDRFKVVYADKNFLE